MHRPTEKLSEQLLVQEICSSSNAMEAHRLFESYAAELKQWRVIFADKSDVGCFKLLGQELGSSGIASSVFRGKSLWLMDAPFVSQTGMLGFRVGSAMFLDSNAASYIRTIAYQKDPSPEVLNRALLINRIGLRLENLNPYLYLLESFRSWNNKTAAKCKESVAAIYALAESRNKLSIEWGTRYRSMLRECAENFAIGLISEFEREWQGGLFSSMQEQLDLMEAILVRTKIIEMSSNKSKENKFVQLIVYMHEELSTFALRELIICGDILSRSSDSRIAKKLNSIQNHRNPLAVIKNCAWDMYIPRALDTLSSVRANRASYVDFYVPEILSFDGDVSDIIKTTKLRAVAFHRQSKMILPFFDNDLVESMNSRLGYKRMRELSVYFQPDAFLGRVTRRHSISVKSILEADREHLMYLIGRKKS